MAEEGERKELRREGWMHRKEGIAMGRMEEKRRNWDGKKERKERTKEEGKGVSDEGRG